VSDTIFALSSGAPPAAIAVVRISGPAAPKALSALTSRPVAADSRALRTLRDPSGPTLDRALVLTFRDGPTGEPTVELHLHGGRAVIAAVLAALARLPGLRPAKPGEFTRRAFANGKNDLAEAEGLADLLAAETELQRQAAVEMAGGTFSRTVHNWRDRLLAASAQIEAQLDFGDEDDVSELPESFTWNIAALSAELAEWLRRPRAEALREGFRVVLAGPPNVGKSTLFNALVEAEAAITSPIAGTTRDVLTRPVALEGVPFTFCDTAGLHTDTADPVEQIGVARAEAELARADLILWLGPEGSGPSESWEIAAQSDRLDAPRKNDARHRVSAKMGEGIAELRADLVATARTALPKPGQGALSARQHTLLSQAETALVAALSRQDHLLIAEQLRLARVAFDGLLGRTTTEDMLDTLFARFCIGK
jgi:tRNA modification GTPase